jgi:hypothetical protein
VAQSAQQMVRNVAAQIENENKVYKVVKRNLVSSAETRRAFKTDVLIVSI